MDRDIALHENEAAISLSLTTISTTRMVTVRNSRNIFTWLRDEGGFPVAERAIREHEVGFNI
jgi:hypothetical protein